MDVNNAGEDNHPFICFQEASPCITIRQEFIMSFGFERVPGAHRKERMVNYLFLHVGRLYNFNQSAVEPGISARSYEQTYLCMCANAQRDCAWTRFG